MQSSLPILSAGLGLVLLASAAFPQGLPPTTPLDSGRLVRLLLTDGSVVKGRLLAPVSGASGDIVFCGYPAPPCRPGSDRAVRLEAALVREVEVKRGTRLWRGAAIGAGIGGALGWFAAWFDNEMCDSYGCGTSVPAWTILGAVQFGAWGALFGSQSVVWGPP